jgi:hypothetical protein
MIPLSRTIIPKYVQIYWGGKALLRAGKISRKQLLKMKRRAATHLPTGSNQTLYQT